MENMKELSLREMEEVSGGAGGYSSRPRKKEGFSCYQIQHGDTLRKIASRFGTTAEYLLSINPSITNINYIVVGYYIYVPE